MITSEEIKQRLWDGANALRGSMDASRYKDYMLGLMFYKFLSDKTLEAYKKISGVTASSEQEVVDSYEEAYATYGDQLTTSLQKILGYFVLPEFLYQRWVYDIQSGDFAVQKVTDSLEKFENTIPMTAESNGFKGLFSSSTLNLSDTALGSDLHARSKNIKALIELFADLNMIALQKGDVLGDAYEYLIGKFAMESGKKAGEFYTPHQVSDVMARIVSKTDALRSIYDPTVGSGSLLLTVKKYLSHERQQELNYYGQEKNTATYNLTRMNLLLHGVRPEKMTIKNGDTLAEDWPEDPQRPSEGILFDAVVMNPPYSLKDWNRSGIKVSDPRFEIAGVLPPDSKGDFAFLLHGLFHLGPQGTMAIVLPHGVLFRGSSEGVIRKKLLEKNYVDAVIGLPSNLFTNTDIPVVVMVLKKNRKMSEPVLVIDASKQFIKVGKQHVLREKDIEKIIDVYVNRNCVAGYSHLATRDELVANEYNLNISRYVVSDSDNVPHDVDAHLYGGIPQNNIANLTVLNALASEELQQALEVIRPGYLQITIDPNILKEQVLQTSAIDQKRMDVESAVQTFISKYWDILKGVTGLSQIPVIMENMLREIKEILSQIEYIDYYQGYQIISDKWKHTLNHDLEVIVAHGFYEVARMREPNMVLQGKKGKQVQRQQGWIGSLIPIELVEKTLYGRELQVVSEQKRELLEIDAELSRFVEEAMDDTSDLSDILNPLLKRNKENEVGDAFDRTLVKAAVKQSSNDSDSQQQLVSIQLLLDKQQKLKKKVKVAESALTEMAANRIVDLSEAEVDRLVFEKWFGNIFPEMTNLTYTAILSELETLSLLHKRYGTTLSQLDQDILTVEKEVALFMNQLEVIE